RLVDVDEHSTMNVEITKPLGYLDILLHRTPKHADLPTELLRHIEHDLQTMNGRGEGGNDDATRRLSEDFFEGRNDGTLRRRSSGNCRVGGIGKQSQHAFLSVPPKGSQVDRFADDGCLVNFIVARVNN